MAQKSLPIVKVHRYFNTRQENISTNWALYCYWIDTHECVTIQQNSCWYFKLYKKQLFEKKYVLWCNLTMSGDFGSSYIPYLMFFTRSFLIKSLASSEMSSKASSSKSYWAMVTLAIVSTSVSPMKGDKPESLKQK